MRPAQFTIRPEHVDKALSKCLPFTGPDAVDYSCHCLVATAVNDQLAVGGGAFRYIAHANVLHNINNRWAIRVYNAHVPIIAALFDRMTGAIARGIDDLPPPSIRQVKQHLPLEFAATISPAWGATVNYPNLNLF